MPVLAIVNKLLNGGIEVQYIDITAIDPTASTPSYTSKIYNSSDIEVELLNPPSGGVRVVRSATGETIDQVYTLDNYEVDFIFNATDTLRATTPVQFYEGIKVLRDQMLFADITTPNPIPQTP